MSVPWVDPRQLRPRRFWYGVGAALLLIGFAGGALGFGMSLWRVLALPEFTVHFSSGETATVEVDRVGEPSRAWLVYADEPISAIGADCTVEGEGAHSQLDFAHSHEVESGGQYWGLVGRIQVEEPGRYEITCDSEREVDYAVAYGDSVGGFAQGVALVFAAAGLPVLVGAAGGVVVLVVTGVRRSRHRRRLQYPDPHGGPLPLR